MKIQEIKTESFGTLTLEYILLEKKYPRIFIAKNESNERFLLCESEIAKEQYTWLFYKVSNAEIVLLNDGSLTLEQLWQKRKPTFLTIKKGEQTAIETRYRRAENITFLKQPIYLGFLQQKDKGKIDEKLQKFDLEEVQLLHKKEQENIDNPEEFEISEEQREKKETTDFEGEYDDFDFGLDSPKNANKKEIVSKDEFDEDLEDYEEIDRIEYEPLVEEGEKQKEYFDDWDYKNPEKVELEKQRKEQRKKDAAVRKAERQKSLDDFGKKCKSILKSGSFWTKVLIALLTAVMFITVFAAIFANKQSENTEPIQIPDVTEPVEDEEAEQNYNLIEY